MDVWMDDTLNEYLLVLNDILTLISRYVRRYIKYQYIYVLSTLCSYRLYLLIFNFFCILAHNFDVKWMKYSYSFDYWRTLVTQNFRELKCLSISMTRSENWIIYRWIWLYKTSWEALNYGLFFLLYICLLMLIIGEICQQAVVSILRKWLLNLSWWTYPNDI